MLDFVGMLLNQFKKCYYFTEAVTFDYLVDTKVCIRVKVVVSWGHLIWAEELGHLAPPWTSRKAGSMGCVWRTRRAHSMLNRRHRLGQRGGLCRLGWNNTDWLRLCLWLLEKRDKKKKPKDTQIALGERRKTWMKQQLGFIMSHEVIFIHGQGLTDDVSAIPLTISICCNASQLICQKWFREFTESREPHWVERKLAPLKWSQPVCQKPEIAWRLCPAQKVHP